MSPIPQSGLAGLTVLEIAATPGAAFAASLLADFNATVLVLETATGSGLRRDPLDWAILARNKQSLIVEPTDLPALFARADLLVTDLAAPQRAGHPWFAALDRLAATDRPLLVEVFPTGADRPDLWPWGVRAEFAAATSGMMAITGPEDGPPVQPEAPVAEYLAGALAAAQALAALAGRNPVPVSVPLHRAVQRMVEWQTVVASACGAPELRRGNSFPMNAGIANMHRTADGHYLALSAVTQTTAERLLAMVGGEALRTDPRFATTEARARGLDALYRILDAWMGARTLADIQVTAAAHDVILGPVYTTADMLADAQIAARHNFVEVDGIVQPDILPTIDGIETRIRNLGPSLGENRYQDPSAESGGRLPARGPMAAKPSGADAPRPASEGTKKLRVLELGTVIAGPFAGSLLAELGCEVIKIEPPGQGDPLRAMGRIKDGVALWFGVSGRAKRCLALDLKDPQGKAHFTKLIESADVIVENYRPGVLDRLGFGWPQIHAINPRLVMLSISGFGQTGPQSARPGFGKIAEGMSGVVSLTGDPAAAPLFVGFSLADACTGLFGAFAVQVALHHRDHQPGGLGTRIDLALYEPLLRMLDRQLALHRRLGTPPLRKGSNDPLSFGQADPARPRFLSLQAGDGAWYFLAAPANADLAPLRALSGEALRAAARQAGIDLVPVFDGASIAADPYFRARGDVVEAGHPKLGRFWVPGPVDGGSARFATPALGEHGDDILRGLP